MVIEAEIHKVEKTPVQMVEVNCAPGPSKDGRATESRNTCRQKSLYTRLNGDRFQRSHLRPVRGPVNHGEQVQKTLTGR